MLEAGWGRLRDIDAERLTPGLYGDCSSTIRVGRVDLYRAGPVFREKLA
jgi:hypothetical protein